ncbi:ImmA/IrrE family metallo-endopeptidase [Lysinibacillus fusiformis]|uniref:ImmA/IrrE family metallo-endopeptidase n=1 Tax=Lysinibacillus fusiformis TaxID=28031 RepID=UPI001FCB04B7|nr:ImmA/IrrE family metallo-endopeptidase [Lysinibacillus fusiformis]
MSTFLTHTEEYIKTFYLTIGISSPQDIQFLEISNHLGISTFYWSEQSQALFTGNKRFILLNENLSPQQQWQEFCHELAHVLLHTGDQFYMTPLFREYQEHKANNFMYHACIPTFMLDELQIYDCTKKTVIKIQELFNVEYEFALKRLTQYHNKLILQNQYHIT